MSNHKIGQTIAKGIDMRAWDKRETLSWRRKMFWIMAGVLSAFFFILLTTPPKPTPLPIKYTPLHSPPKIVTPSATLAPTKAPLREVTNAGRGRWQGYVSHYSRAGCLGCSATLTMANGETLDDNRATIAFNWLPMNTRVRITNTDNGKSIEAVVTDTGGFNRLNRIADLVPAVANYLETKTDRSLVIIEQL